MSDRVPRVAVVDYQLGNLFSVRQACLHVGLDAVVTSDVADLERADGLILPGVGAFAAAMATLAERGLVEPIRRLARAGVPIVGVCLGMQLLFDESEEFGRHEGLGLVAGRVTRFPDATAGGEALKVPHVGWNRVVPNAARPADAELLGSRGDEPYMYFVHSYYCAPEHVDDRLATTTYGGVSFASAVRRGNVVGVQFHPERSGPAGLRFYRSLTALMGRQPRVNVSV